MFLFDGKDITHNSKDPTLSHSSKDPIQNGPQFKIPKILWKWLINSKWPKKTQNGGTIQDGRIQDGWTIHDGQIQNSQKIQNGCQIQKDQQIEDGALSTWPIQYGPIST